MALFGIRKSFRPSPAELPLALQELLGEVKEEKAELEVVLERVRNAAKSMGEVDRQLVDVTRRQDEFAELLASAESRADGVSELSDEVARARDRAAELEQGQGGGRGGDRRDTRRDGVYGRGDYRDQGCPQGGAEGAR